MRIGYITYYNTPDNLRIALEDNLIEISAKNSENHKLCMITNTFVQIALQCNAASHVCIREGLGLGFTFPIWQTILRKSSGYFRLCDASLEQ